MKAIFKIITLALVVSVTACKEEKKMERTPARVRITSVSGNISSSDTYSGTVEEETGASISFQVPGIIEQLPIHVGQYVKAGQLIASVDPTTMQNTYNAAEAALRQARDAYERMKQLHERGSIPEIQWVEIQSKLSQAESSERIAKKNLQDCRLIAPFSGVIISKDMEVGQSAMPGMPVVKLGKIENVNVCISVPESELGGIRLGSSAEIRVPALNSAVFQGKVAEKGIAANPLSHTYEVKILVNNNNARLLPGMVAKVTLENSGTGGQTLVLPGSYIGIDERNRTFVWIVKDGKAHRQFVECGRPLDNGVEIRSGLSASDSIIMEGQQRVSENMNVEVIDYVSR